MTTANGNGATNGAAPNGAASPDTPPPLTEAQVRRIEQLLVSNVSTLRRELFSRLIDRRRDIYAECGYPATSAIEAHQYQDLYDREAIAARVVEVLPKETWQVQPTIYEEEDAETVTAFEGAWDALGNSLRGERSWYEEESGSPLWEYLKRADELSGIGQYGVILLGLDDGLEMSQPAAGVEEINSAPASTKADKDPIPQPSVNGVYRLTFNAKAARRLLYLRVFPEHLIQVTRLETNRTSPRYCQPVEYLVTFNDPRDAQLGGVVGSTTSTKNVHWTRIVHIADNLASSEVFGAPRMRPVLNNLLGLQKLYCGSPEMYWKGAFYGLAAETNPSLGGDVDVDKPAMRDSMENYFNGLQRFLLGEAISFKTLAPTVVDPSPQIMVQIEAICIKLGIPKRVFMGSERGELASSQDDAAWNDRLRERQRNYVTPRIIVPFVDRCIALGILPEPKQGYCVSWPDLTSQSDSEKASVANVRTTALATYVSGGVEALIPPLDYLTRILGFTEEEATAILDNAESAAQDTVTIPPAGSAGHPASAPTPPTIVAPGAAAPGSDSIGGTLNSGDNCGVAAGGFQPGNTCAKGGGGKAPKAEVAASNRLALDKIKAAVPPSREAVEKAREELARAKRGEGRAGGDSRGGSAASRRQQRENLFNEWGGAEKGYVVCPWTGIKMHHTDDPKKNPHGYPKFERGKIFVKCQGGGYQLSNLIPESFAANRSRNDARLRSENSKGC